MAAVASVCIFGALVLFIAWYARSGSRLEERVRSLSAQQREIAEMDDPFTQRVMFPVVHGFTNRVMDFMPTSVISRSRKWLLVSDSTMSLSSFMTIVLVTATALPALLFLALVRVDAQSRAYLVVPVVAAFGFLLPIMMLRRRAKNRQSAFWKALPDAMDLLTTCVEAGLSLDFAFQRLAERQRGPVGDEVNRMLREKALGQTRKEALLGMAERIDLPDVNVFVNSIIQAETLGTSIGQVLRTQSRQLRIRRRQRAEQIARQAAPKMVFPLVFFVMPSLFVVMLGPILINGYNILTS